MFDHRIERDLESEVPQSRKSVTSVDHKPTRQSNATASSLAGVQCYSTRSNRRLHTSKVGQVGDRRAMAEQWEDNSGLQVISSSRVRPTVDPPSRLSIRQADFEEGSRDGST
jgi:hypothetical protein